MKIDTFGVEMWMNEWETKCEFNLAETSVESLTIDHLFFVITSIWFAFHSHWFPFSDGNETGIKNKTSVYGFYLESDGYPSKSCPPRPHPT